MGERVFLNGDLVPREDAHVSIYDHGFLYGDGAFEGIRVYNRRVFKLQAHVARLYRSAHALAIKLCTHPQELISAIVATVRANNLETGYVRVTISRGVGLGLDPAHMKDVAPTIVVSTAQLGLYKPEMYENGLEVITASTRVPPAQCIDPQVKSLGKYINSINAKMEANRVGAGEALMLNVNGNVAEATGDNLFLVSNGELTTPPTSEGALPGITRATVIELAKEIGLPFRESITTLFDCYTADEAFLTGTAAEVIPMVRLDGREIGDGRPGPMTARLIAEFRQATATDGLEV